MREKEPVGAAPFSRNTHIAPADRIGIDEPFLVDLNNDLGETTNVADQNPEVVERLLALAESMRVDLGDYDRVGKNMRFFDLVGERPTKPPVPDIRKPKAKNQETVNGCRHYGARVAALGSEIKRDRRRMERIGPSFQAVVYDSSNGNPLNRKNATLYSRSRICDAMRQTIQFSEPSKLSSDRFSNRNVY